MAIPNLMLLQFAGTNVQVWNTIGGALDAQIGSDVSALDVAIVEDTRKAHNRVVEFKGKKYCIGSTASASTVTVCEENTDGAGLWGSVYTSAVAAQGTGRGHSGLYIIHDGADQLLCFTYKQSSTTTIRIAKSNDGASWASEVAINSGLTQHYGLGTVFQNTIWFVQGNTKLAQVNPVAGAVTVYTVSEGLRRSTLVVFRDTLYMVKELDNGLGLGLYEFTGSGFSFNTTIHDPGGSWSENDKGQHAAWATDGVIHVIGIGGKFNSGAVNGQGSHYYTLTPDNGGFSVQDLTATVIPSGIQPDRINNTGDKWYVHVSTDNDPTSPETYLFHVPSPSTDDGSWTVFQFTTNASELTTLAAPGPSVEYAPPITPFGSGEHINKGEGNRAEIEDSEAGFGGFKMFIRIYGSLTGQVLRIYYSTDQHAPNKLATLLSVSGGAGSPSLNGNNTQIDDVDGDSGATLMTVIWNMGADGILSPNSVHLQPVLALS